MAHDSPANPTTAASLAALDDYALMELIDHLAFDDILKLADLSVALRATITARYLIPKYRLHQRLVCFTVAMDEHQPDSRVVIHAFSAAARLLRVCGHLITRIKLSGMAFTAEQLTLLGDYMAKYSRNTLLELELHDVGNSELITDASKVFPRVTKLKMSSLLLAIDGASLKIHQIYPNLREFTYSGATFTRIPQIFPNLMRFELIENGPSVDDSAIRAFLTLNPRLTSLSLSRTATFDLMKFIQNNLENLEALEIGYLSHAMQPPNNEILHFARIQQLVITPMARGNILQAFPMTFDRLVSLEIRANDYFNVPITLIKGNAAIKVLGLPWLDGRQALHVLSDVKDSHRFEEITMKLANIDAMAEIFESINGFGALRRVTFIVHDLVGKMTNRRAVLNAIPIDGWHLKEFKAVEMELVDVYHVIVSRRTE